MNAKWLLRDTICICENAKAPIWNFKKVWVYVSFADESFSREKCSRNVKETKKLLASLSPIIHSTKSILEIPQSFGFLGSFIDSRATTVKVTPEQSVAIIKEIETFISKSKNHY